MAKWVEHHGTPLTTIYVTHPHANHFLGLPAVMSAFPDAEAVALPDAIRALQGQVAPAAMQVWNAWAPGSGGRCPRPTLAWVEESNLATPHRPICLRVMRGSPSWLDS